MIIANCRYEHNIIVGTIHNIIGNLSFIKQRDSLCILVKYIFAPTLSRINLKLTLFDFDTLHVFYWLENSYFGYCLVVKSVKVTRKYLFMLIFDSKNEFKKIVWLYHHLVSI